MANQYVIQEKKKIDPWMVVILVFLGWLGIDKIYYKFRNHVNASWWKFWLVKFGYNLIFVGILWNIFDIIQYCRHKYEYDFRDYFK